MAKYTTQIRTLVENGYDLFDFTYPIFDETYRSVLEQNIINHYYFREIGFETVGQFKHFLKTKMQLIMPYYNRYYETEYLITKDDYMINLDNTTTRTVSTDQTTNQDSTSTGTGTSSGKSVFSDTPQARLQGEDYATSLTEADDTSSSTQSGTATGKLTTIEEYQEKFLGNASMRYNADVLQEWRDSWLNIDKLIIDELQDLFMNIY